MFPRLLILLVLLFSRIPVSAWVYFEHRDIGVLAIRNLVDADRALLDRLWAQARTGYERRLSDSVIDVGQGLNPDRLDLASWFAISGDHSCSPQDLLANVLSTDWIMKVASISAKLKEDMLNSRSGNRHINLLHQSDIFLLRADPEYATRAGANNVHFLLGRRDADITSAQYLMTCLAKNAPLNAVGAYGRYHLAALMKAYRYAHEALTPEAKSELIRSALADEAYALHFLEDAFSAGHIAGTWGSSSLRKGTHDYYNEKGIEVMTWNGRRMVLAGDSYMRPDDAKVAALAVQKSIEQLLNAARGVEKPDYAGDINGSTLRPDSLSTCSQTVNVTETPAGELILEIFETTPVPGLYAGIGERPRFRSELGKFLGLSSSFNSSLIFRGFGNYQPNAGLVTGLEANIRFGFGLEGVVDQSADALMFVQFGWKLNGASTNQLVNTNGSIPTGTITAAIPGRTGLNFRVRAPFWLVPGDLLLAGPLLFFVAPDELKKMGVVAANGGLLPWQSAIATPLGRFQFVLGREMGVTFYGLNKTSIELLIPDQDTTLKLVKYRSTALDFPILEFMPLRNFSRNQSFDLTVQVTGGCDIPTRRSVVAPVGETTPVMKTIWQIGIRVLFNWRYYLSSQ